MPLPSDFNQTNSLAQDSTERLSLFPKLDASGSSVQGTTTEQITEHTYTALSLVLLLERRSINMFTA